MHSRPKLEGSNGKQANTPTHWESLFGNQPFIISELELPITCGRYLLDELEDFGPYKTGFNGPEPQTWTEVVSYGKVVDHLNTRELTILHQLSEEWIRGFQQGKIALSRSPLELLENTDG